MYMYLRGECRHFHKEGSFLFSRRKKNRISKPFFFFFNRNIKRYRDVIQSENYKYSKKKNDKGETANIL